MLLSVEPASPAVVTIDGSTHSVFAAAGITLSQGNFVGNLTGNITGSLAGATAGTLPLTAVDIDGATATTTVADADLLVIDDGANGTNRKVTATTLKDYFLGGGAGANFTAINVSGIGTLGQADATTLKVSGISTFTGVVDINGVEKVTIFVVNFCGHPEESLVTAEDGLEFEVGHD